MQPINEQLLTAYALDELPLAVRMEVKAYLARHPEAEAEVEAIRAAAKQLQADLMTEVQATPRPAITVPAPIRIRPRWQVPVALAASVAVVVGTFVVLMPTRRVDQSVAMQSEPNLRRLRSQKLEEQRFDGVKRDNNEHFEGLPVPTPPPNASIAAATPGPAGHGVGGPVAASPAPPVFRNLGRDGQSNLTLGVSPDPKALVQKREADLSRTGGQSPAAPAEPAHASDSVLHLKIGERPNDASVGGTAAVAGTVTNDRELRGGAVDRLGKQGQAAQKPQTEWFAKAGGQVAAGDKEKLDLALRGPEPAPPPPVVPNRPGSVFDRNGIQDTAHNTETYDRITDNAFLDAVGNPLSTFSIDVDTASYSNMRRFVTGGQLPPKDAVRIEEMVNYFPYQYSGPKPEDKEKPFAASVEIAGCPWNTEHRLVRVGIKGREMSAEQRPASNLVFLIDVSGSMNEPNKLPLVKQSLRELVNKLDSRDRVAMVVYAGNSGLVLESTPVGGFSDKDANDLWHNKYEPLFKGGANDRGEKVDIISEDDARAKFVDEVTQLKQQRSSGRQKILAAIDRLEAGGSTNGGAGIELAYLTAQSGFIKDGTNRVILATDGDWNVGVTDQGALTRLIEDKAKGGTFLTVLGFGMGNTKDSTMEKLADKGNGNYAYIDNLAEAKKVLVEQMSGTLVTIAKDVKIQVEFNPAKVQSYRLIGYENRLLAKEDFNDDKKDAGEIGAGHTVTALYEVVPPGVKSPTTQAGVDPLKYKQPPQNVTGQDMTGRDVMGEMLTLKLRYKAPDAPADVQGTSKLLEFPITDAGKTYAQGSEDFKFAAAVAGFGMILRDSPYKGTSTYDSVIELAGEGKGPDANGYRQEFIQLVQQAKTIAGK